MIKKCKGCGVVLQSDDINKIGYTPNINNKICQRCFKIKNYGEAIDSKKEFDNESIIKKINNDKKFVIFLVDFLNIYSDIIDLYKSIKTNKILVVTKSDLIPKNIRKSVLIERIKKVYNINEDIILTSSKTKENISQIRNILINNKETIIVGFTSSGKSSLINALTGSDLTISKNSNTTQDFIKINTDDFIIYDTPGFINSNYLESLTPKNIIKPITYQLKNIYCLKLLNMNITSNIDNSFTFYISNEVSIDKRRIKEEFSESINVDNNIDLIIKGLGFINIKKDSIIKFDFNKELIEIRPSIVGDNNEQD